MRYQAALIGAALCCTVCSPCTAQEVTVERGGRPGPRENQVFQASDKYPGIRYGTQRRSKRWLEVEGVRMAADDGIEWSGRCYYLTLTYDLVATEPGAPPAEPAPGAEAARPAERALWRRFAGAFWNQLTIERCMYAPDGGEALALRSTEHPELVEFVDLATGRRIGGTDPDGDAPGAPLALGGAWQGDQGRSDASRLDLLRSLAAWTTLRAELFGDLPEAPPVDPGISFDDFGLVVVYEGRGFNCSGFSARAFENERAVVLRVKAHTFQTAGEAPPRHPYGVFAVPLRPGKDLVLESNQQNLIGGPALWREWQRWPIR